MKYSTIFCDYDNTLYGDSHEVSDVTISAVKEFVENGGNFIISTGRIFQGIKPIADKLGLTGDIITAQGASIYNIETSTLIYENPIPKLTALKVIKFLNDMDCYAHFYHNNKIYINEENGMTMLYENYFDVTLTSVENSLLDYITINDINPAKIEALVDMDKVDEVINACNEKFGDELKFTKTTGFLIEIVRADATKGRAVSWICQKNNIDIKNVMAIGDGHNDIDMLEAVGYGVAVGNANEKLKAVADFVCETSTDDGVAKMLKRIAE